MEAIRSTGTAAGSVWVFGFRLGAVVSSLAFALGRLPSLVSGLSRRVSEAPFPSHECTSGLMARCNGLSLADRCAKRVHQLRHAGLVYFAGLMAWVLAVLGPLWGEIAPGCYAVNAEDHFAKDRPQRQQQPGRELIANETSSSLLTTTAVALAPLPSRAWRRQSPSTRHISALNLTFSILV